MIPICKKPYKDGDLRIGWASWDKDKDTNKMRYTYRSIKYAYLTDNGNVSRGAPELPFDILLDMAAYAAETGELDGFPAEVKAAHQKLEVVLKKLGITP